MLRDVKEAYQKAAFSIKADGTIPSGELFGAILDSGKVDNIHRDTFHASFGLGRYALGLLWYRFLTGKDVMNNPFCDFDEIVPEEHVAVAKKCVTQLAEKHGF